MIQIHSIQQLVTLQHTQIEKGYRSLCLVENATANIIAELKVIITSSGANPDKVLHWPKQAYTLGEGYHFIIFNAESGFHPDHFCALMGSLAGGGILFLTLDTDFANWPHMADAEYAKMAQYDNLVPHHRFIARFTAQIAKTKQSIYRIDAKQLLRKRLNDGLEWQRPTEPQYPLKPTLDQKALIQAIERGMQRDNLCINLLADRGRGKTSGIAMALAMMLKKNISTQTPLQCYVCTPKKSQARLLLTQTVQHLGLALTDIPKKNSLKLAHGAQQIRWIPIDTLLQQDQVCGQRLVIVDEAAGFGVHKLSRLAQQETHLLFSTTVIGYEGSGQGFAIHFSQQLQQQTPKYLQIELTHPLRWHPSDPLEHWLNETCLFKHKPNEIKSLPANDLLTDSLEVTVVDLDQLSQDETKLAELFELLRTAHYRTRPSDLRLLLDAPGQHLFAAVDQQDQLVGVAWICQDGPLPEALHEAIRLGKRRLPGHRLPQYLCRISQRTYHLHQKMGRVIRIAVKENARRQGVGSKMVEAVIKFAGDQAWEAVGTQFSAQHTSVIFWAAQGFGVWAQGEKIQASTGNKSLTYMKWLSPPVLI